MKRKTIILCVTLIISAPATYYAALSVIFYSWLNAAEPDRWPTEKAAIWAGGSLILTIIFFSLFIYSVVSLLNTINSYINDKQQKT